MDMMMCELDRSSSKPLYEQLYLHIKTEILEGRLPCQSKLPSKRKLADYLQISINTIETAYEQLAAEGYVEVLPRKGYFVTASDDIEYSRIQSYEEPIEETPEKESYHFHPGRVDTEYFPFQKWRKYVKAAIDEQHRNLLLLGDPQGEPGLRKEIADYLYQARGVRCSPRQIILGAGIEILLQQLVLLFGKDTAYGVEDPGYQLIQQILSGYPNPIYPLAVDQEGVITEEIEQMPVDTVYVTPSHHFPFGTVLSVNRRARLLHWAGSKENRYIIEDDYDSEFRYSGKAIPSLQSMDASGKVIFLGSFSKSLMPSIRISYMVLPEKLLEEHQKRLSFYHSTVSRIDQFALMQFMAKGDFEKHLNRMRKLYRKKLDIVTEKMASFAPQIQLIGEQSGLHVMFSIDNGMLEEELVQKAEDAGISIFSLSAYSMRVQQDGLPQIILGFAGIPEKELAFALEKLLAVWRFRN